MEQQKQQKASKIYGINKTTQQNKQKQKQSKYSFLWSINTTTNKQSIVLLFFWHNFYVPTESQALEQSMMCMCGCNVYVVGSYDWHRL